MAFTSDFSFDDKRLLARVDDAVTAAREGRTSRFIGFLNERQATFVQAWLTKNAKDVAWRFYGGHDDAERVCLGVFADYDEPCDMAFPIVAVGVAFRQEATITHRDVLGSLIGCGIVREKIGDILCTSGLAVAFIRAELASYVTEQLTKIGREGVTICCPYEAALPSMHTFRDISGTIASPRLDAILKVLLGTSREQASQLIREQLVSINHSVCRASDTALKANDIVSIKGKGRFVIDDLSATTAKGRLVLRARKYL